MNDKDHMAGQAPATAGFDVAAAYAAWERERAGQVPLPPPSKPRPVGTAR